jgi:hypothetical protein
MDKIVKSVNIPPRRYYEYITSEECKIECFNKTEMLATLMSTLEEYGDYCVDYMYPGIIEKTAEIIINACHELLSSDVQGDTARIFKRKDTGLSSSFVIKYSGEDSSCTVLIKSPYQNKMLNLTHPKNKEASRCIFNGGTKRVKRGYILYIEKDNTGFYKMGGNSGKIVYCSKNSNGFNLTKLGKGLATEFLQDGFIPIKYIDSMHEKITYIKNDEGVSLRSIMSDIGELSVEDKTKIVMNILQSYETLYQKSGDLVGVYDIKDSNLLLSPSGDVSFIDYIDHVFTYTTVSQKNKGKYGDVEPTILKQQEILGISILLYNIFSLKLSESVGFTENNASILRFDHEHDRQPDKGLAKFIMFIKKNVANPFAPILQKSFFEKYTDVACFLSEVRAMLAVE